MSERTKKLVKFVAKLVVTIGLLVWVFAQMDMRQLGASMKNARWEFLWVIWLLTVVSYWIMSFKMRIVLRKQGCEAGTWMLFVASAVTSLYSLVLPGMLDNSVKWYILTRHTGRGSNVFSSMAYNQFSTMVLISFAALIALAITNPAGNWQLPVICSGLVLILGLMCLLLLSRRAWRRLEGPLSFLIRPWPMWIQKAIRKVLGQLSVFQAAPWTFHAKVAMLNVLGAVVVGTVIYVLAAKAAGIDVPVGMLIWQCSLIFILGRLPISIANLGVREVTVVGTLGIYGVEPPAAMLMSMIIFSNKLIMALIGAAIQVYWILHKPHRPPAQ